MLVITTEANQNRADVQAFNAKAGIAAAASTAAAAAELAPVPAPAQTEKPTTLAYLMPAALAYLTQHYPGARLLGVKVVPPAAEGEPVRHEAQIVLGRRPAYLLFDGKGQFLSESFNSAAR